MSQADFSAHLTAVFGDRLRFQEPFANHTTFRVGGPAQYWLAATTLEELIQAVTIARQYEQPFFVFGSGANLLVTETGLAGLVIQNRVTGVDFPTAELTNAGSPVTVLVESGVILPNLARRCVKRGLSGLEWAGGVPGTIGGAVVNNAGAYGSDMAHNLRRVELLSPQGDRVWQPTSWLAYDYRSSRLKGMANQFWLVLQAELELIPAPVADIQARMNDYNQRRKASQPPGATIGSMFKNPPGDYAGRLIEAAGLKGYQIGQAQISPVHANFFQNLGQATATEVLSLIRTAQQTVQEKFGITLQLEIEVVGES